MVSLWFEFTNILNHRPYHSFSDVVQISRWGFILWFSRNSNFAYEAVVPFQYSLYKIGSRRVQRQALNWRTVFHIYICIQTYKQADGYIYIYIYIYAVQNQIPSKDKITFPSRFILWYEPWISYSVFFIFRKRFGSFFG